MTTVATIAPTAKTRDMRQPLRNWWLMPSATSLTGGPGASTPAGGCRAPRGGRPVGCGSRQLVVPEDRHVVGDHGGVEQVRGEHDGGTVGTSLDEQVGDGVDAVEVDPVEGLVDEEQRRARDERHRHRQAARLAVRVGARRAGRPPRPGRGARSGRRHGRASPGRGAGVPRARGARRRSGGGRRRGCRGRIRSRAAPPSLPPGWPFTVKSPPLASMAPDRTLRVVDLPQPFGPSIASMRPGLDAEAHVLHDDVTAVRPADPTHVEHGPTVRTGARIGRTAPGASRPPLQSDAWTFSSRGFRRGMPIDCGGSPACRGRAPCSRSTAASRTATTACACADGDQVVRLSDPESSDLAIDRENEYRNSVAAAESGAAPAVTDYLPGEGVLVVAWVEGRTFNEDDVGADGEPAAHRGGVPASCTAGRRSSMAFDMFDIQARYHALVRERGYRLPPRYDEFAPKVERMRAAMARAAGAEGAVQQRPARGQHHRRRLAAVADRLRVLGQQRGELRARQHLERVHAAGRRARPARLLVLASATIRRRSHAPGCGP